MLALLGACTAGEVLVGSVAAAWGQEPPSILVTGSPLPQGKGVSALGQVTLGQVELDGEPSGRLENLLRDLAGFQQFRRGDSRAANPTSQGVTFRSIGGNAASRALVLLDGVPQADPFAGWVPWPALEPGRLGAVRVTRGAGAGAFAAGALTGTVELMSAGPASGWGEVHEVHAQGAVSTRESYRVASGAAIGLGQGHASISGSYEHGDGTFLVPASQRGAVDVPARYQQWSVAARGLAPVSDTTELQMRFAGFSDDRRRGLALAGSTSDGGDASLRLVSRGDWAWEALAYLQIRRFTAAFARVADDRNSATPALDQYNTPATGLGGKLEVRPPVGADANIAAGLDVRRSAGVTRERFSYADGGFTRLREAGGHGTVAGAFLSGDWTPASALTLSASARLDRWSTGGGHLTERAAGTAQVLTDMRYDDRGGWEPTARAGAVYRLTPAIRARAAAYTGFRVPTLNELYRPYRVGADAVAANAALRRERLNGAEAGLDLMPLGTARAGVTLFWNRLDDAIANVTLARGPGVFPQVGFVSGAGSFAQRLNVDAVTARGVEATAHLAPGLLRFDASYAYTHARVSASGVAAALDGLRPAQTPVHAASLSAGIELPGGQGGGRRAGARGGPAATLTARYEGPRFEDDLGTLRLDDAFTLDASARLPLAGGFTLTFAGENLLNERIESGIDSDGLLDLGTPRTIWFGLRWQG